MLNNTLPSQDSKVLKRAVIWKAVSSERQAHDDKVSLSEQERLAREWCDENDYQVIRILEVPGYSRRESDIVTALEDFAEHDIYAYSDLRRMWQNKEFDVLVAYAHDRLGRSNTLHSWVVENIITKGMQIYLLADGGFVTEQDFRFKMAFGGLNVASPIDRLIKAASVAKDKLIQQGLPTGAKIPLSHTLIRDTESGKAIKLVLNEDYRQLFDDLATVFLEGVAYNLISKELYRRFGHVRENGKKYRANYFYELLYSPTFWGHLARGYTASSKNGNQRGAWAFDETVDPPANVIVARNVIPAVYEGDIADAVIAEMRRRMDVTGNRRSSDTYRYAGLFVCGECGTPMGTRSKPKRGRTGLRCSAVYARTYEIECNQRFLTPHRYLQARIEELLEQLVAGINPEIFSLQDDNSDHYSNKLKKLKKERDSLQQKILVLISEQSNAPIVARDLYRQQIETQSNRLDHVANDIQKLERSIEEEGYVSREEVRTLDELRRLTLDCFWRLPDREINQWLRRLMGKRKFVVMDREIIGVVDLPTKKRNKK
ncbi:MAG: hypothetical protein Phog2KO_26370 [Phototrophicaceae bacterium]